MPEKKVKPKTPPAPVAKPRPPEVTHEEVRYIKRLIDEKTPIAVKLAGNEVFEGVIEYYDQSFIRITRDDGPNLFIFKHDIKYLYELD